MNRITGLMAALILGALIAIPAGPQAQNKADVALRAAIETETVKGDLKAAIEQYKLLADGADRAVAAKALVRLGECYQKLGNAESTRAWERVVRDFVDQKDAVADARRLLGAGARPAGGVVMERLVAFPDQRIPRSISRDGRLVLYVAGRDVYVHDLVEHTDRLIVKTSPEAQVDNATILPDGTQVLYDVCPGNLIGCEMYVVKLDGSGRQLLLRANGMYSLDISTDGTQILLVIEGLKDGSRGQDFYVMKADGSALRKVFSGKTNEWEDGVEWSPDGAHVLLNLSVDPSHTRLVLVSVADGMARIVAENSGAGSFSPDGRYIVFQRYDDSALRTSQGIYLAQVDGDRETRLVTTRGLASPTWTADGKRILFRSRRPDQSDPRIPAEHSESWSAPADLYAVRVVDGAPAGTPELLAKDVSVPGVALGRALRDGRVFYSTYFSRTVRDLYQADLDPQTGRITSAAVRVNQHLIGSTVGPPRWSPDGQWLAFARVTNWQKTLALRSTTTGQERELVASPPFDSPANADPIAWLPDSRRLLVGDVASSRRVLRVMDVRTGRTEPFLDRGPVGAQFSAAALSADGKAMFYGASDNSGAAPAVRVMRHDIQRGAETELFRTESRARVGQPLVSPDGTLLAITLPEPDLSSVVWIVPAAGGTARAAHRSKTRAYAQAWTSDGRHLLLVESEFAAGAVLAAEAIRYRLFSLAADGSGLVPAGLEMPFLGGISVHPDGRRVAFIGGYDRNTELWVMKVK
jgi:Tol biopolymer transport system component